MRSAPSGSGRCSASASGAGAKTAEPSEPGYVTQQFAANQGHVWLRFIGRNATLPSLTGNAVDASYLGTSEPYFINDGKIVTSLVNDIIMPPIGLALSGIDFKDIKIVLRAANEAASQPEVAINIGLFLNSLLSFIIIAFVLFLIIRAMNRMMQKEAEKPAAPPAPSTEEKLLMEIRDLLAKGL